jgi:hypothetical protein
MKHQRTQSDYATSNSSNPDTMNDHIQVEMLGQESQLNNRMEVDSILSLTLQSAEMPEINN